MSEKSSRDEERVNSFPAGVIVHGVYVRCAGQRLDMVGSPFHGLIIPKLDGYSMKVM